MIPDKAPQENVLHGSEDLKKEAHVPSFDKYRELYLRSIESPDGESQSSSFTCGTRCYRWCVRVKNKRKTSSEWSAGLT